MNPEIFIGSYAEICTRIIFLFTVLTSFRIFKYSVKFPEVIRDFAFAFNSVYVVLKSFILFAFIVNLLEINQTACQKFFILLRH